MKVPVYNQEGKEVKKADIPKEIFGVEMNPDLVHQVIVSQMANRRQGSAHTKDRSEVRGGGKKPWRQKGTGRARHGSTRSPIWKGGGVTFGPRKEKNYKKRIPREMRRKALFMSLSAKLKDDEIIFINDFEIESPKTKTVKEAIGKLPSKLEKNTLMIFSAPDKNIILGARNIPKVEIMTAKDINATDILSFKNIVLQESAIGEIKKTFLSKSVKN